MDKRYPAILLWKFLEEYRYKNDLSQKEICDRVGWNPPFYSKLKIEGQQLNASTIMKVKKALNVSFDDIIKSNRMKAEEILNTYPEEMLDWMISEDGLEYITSGFRQYVTKKAQAEVDRVLKKMP